MNKLIPDDVMDYIRALECDGNKVIIPMQLSQELYVKVNEVLENLGGKWNRKLKVHIFDEDTATLLAEVLETGIMPPKNPLGFFETPIPVIERMLDMVHANAIPIPDHFLEPSAGNGAIVKYMLSKFPNIEADCIELDSKRCDKLREIGPSVVAHEGDFLDIVPVPYFRLILMNPPFAVERDGLEYIEHIHRAYRWLRNGGILVSVAPSGIKFRTDKRTALLRGSISTKGHIDGLPENSFNVSDTEVSTVLITLIKDDSKNYQKVSAIDMQKAEISLATVKEEFGVSVLQENLVKGMRVVSRIIHRSTFPILGNVLLSASDGRLRLCTTDLETSISYWIGARVNNEFSITVPAKPFTDLVASLSKGKIVNMQLNNNVLNLYCDKLNTAIEGVDAKEFPPMPAFDKSNSVQINAVDFKNLIQQCIYAVSDDEVRPALAGAYLTIARTKLTLSTADGHRLATCKYELSNPSTYPINAIIPAEALKELVHIIKDDQILYVVVLPGYAVFILKDIEVYARLIEATYPNIDYVIPKSYAIRVTLSTEQFLQGCKQLIKVDKDAIARISVTSGKVELSESGGKMKVDLDATIKGPDLIIDFSAKYLWDMLNSIKTSEVAMEATTDSKACVFRPVGNDDSLHVIMPMHLL
jgi:DNA polymerase-3 subunit beta